MGTARVIARLSLALRLGADDEAYRRLMEPLLRNLDKLAHDVLGAFRWMRYPFLMALFEVLGLIADPTMEIAREITSTGISNPPLDDRRSRSLINAGFPDHDPVTRGRCDLP